MKAIVNGNLCSPDQVLAWGTVLIEGEWITGVGSADALTVPPEAEVIDAEGMAVVPGFIHLHLHGLRGHDAMGPDLAQVIRELPAFGVTTFLATTLSLPREETLAALQAMADVLDSSPSGAQGVGIHLEGPFLSPTRQGMATPDWFEPLT